MQITLDAITSLHSGSDHKARSLENRTQNINPESWREGSLNSGKQKLIFLPL